MNYLIDISYIGTNFSGFAKQINLRTIQGEVEKILSDIFEEKISIISCSRTDKYVHALTHVSNFKSDKIFNENYLFNLIKKALPVDIWINKLEIVSDKFHSRFSCKSKTYFYKINIGKFNFFEKEFCYQLNEKLSIWKLKKISKLFIGTHDFLSFSTSDLEHSTRTINYIKIKKINNYIYFYINGDGFLRNMVRMIVASMIDYSKNKKTKTSILDLLSNPKKGTSINKAPGCGLYLFSLLYK